MKTPFQQAWSAFASAFSRSRQRTSPIAATQPHTSDLDIPQPQPQPQPDQERPPTHLNTANESSPETAVDIQCNSDWPENSQPVSKPSIYFRPMRGLPVHAAASATVPPSDGASSDCDMAIDGFDSAPISRYYSPVVSSLTYTSLGREFGASISTGDPNVDNDWQMADDAPITYVAGSYHGADVEMESQYDIFEHVRAGPVDVEMSDLLDEPDHDRSIVQAATPTVGLASSGCGSTQDDDPLLDIPTTTMSPSFVLPTPIILAPISVAIPEVPATLAMAVVATNAPATSVETATASVQAPASENDALLAFVGDIPPQVEANLAQVQAPAPLSTLESAPASAPMDVAQAGITPASLSASASVEAEVAVPQAETAPAGLAPATPAATVSASDSPMIPVPSQLPPVPELHNSSSSSSSSDSEPESPRTPTLPTPPPFALSKPQANASYHDILADVIFGQRTGDASLMRLARRERNRLKEMANVLGVVKPKKAPKSSPAHIEHSVSGGVQSRRAVGVSPYQRAAAARKAQRRRFVDEDDDMGLSESGSAFWPPPVAPQEEEEEDDDDDERVRQGMAEYSQAQDVFKNALVSMGVMDASQFRPLQLTNEESVEELPDYDDNEDADDEGDSDSDDSSVATVEDVAVPATPVSEKAAEDFILTSILGAQAGEDGVMA